MSMLRCCCVPSRLARRDFGEDAALLKAIADPYRLKILASLAQTKGDVCVCDFTDALPLNQPTVSHHLRILREAELVTCERRGTWIYYRIAPRAHRRLQEALSVVFPAEKMIA